MEMISSPELSQMFNANNDQILDRLKSRDVYNYKDNRVRFWDKENAVHHLKEWVRVRTRPEGDWLTRSEIDTRYGKSAFKKMYYNCYNYGVVVERHGQESVKYYYKAEDVEAVSGCTDKSFNVEYIAKLCGTSSEDIINTTNKFDVEVKDNQIHSKYLRQIFKGDKKVWGKITRKENIDIVVTLNKEIKIEKIIPVKGTVLRVFNHSKFLFIPENGVGVCDCQLLCEPPENLNDIIFIEGGNNNYTKITFYVKSFKLKSK